MLIFALCVIFPYVQSEPCGEEWTFVARLHSCYMVPHHPLTWHDAENYCWNEGGHLVSVGSEEESNFVRALANQHNPQFLTWVGLIRGANLSYSDQYWLWSDGTPVNYTKFRSDEPSVLGDCVALSSSLETNGWMTIDCEYSQFFLCEVPAKGTAPIVLRTDFGEFYSPEHLNNCHEHILAYYFIELPTDQRVLITIEHITGDELQDILEIFDGTSEGSPTLVRLSGVHYNRSFLSQSNAVMAIFSSSGSDCGASFKAQYSSWSSKPLERLHNKGEVHSINFPGYTSPYTFQHFLIQCSSDQHVHFNISDFDVAAKDDMVFYDGSSSSHPVLLRLSAKFYRSSLFFRSAENIIYIVFEARDTFKVSRWRFRYNCVRKDGVGDEIIIP